MIAELDGDTNLVNNFIWGLDLSGSEQGAGGVGGLLMFADHSSADTHFVGHDGNGNVVRLVDGSLGTATASYEYSPFGKRISATGTMALANPFRLSNKYEDDESGFSYYGHRFYDPDTGRWLNRDPIDEQGGNNLYGFVFNDPLGNSDPDGREAVTITCIVIAGIIVFCTGCGKKKPKRPPPTVPPWYAGTLKTLKEAKKWCDTYKKCKRDCIYACTRCVEYTCAKKCWKKGPTCYRNCQTKEEEKCHGPR